MAKRTNPALWWKAPFEAMNMLSTIDIGTMSQGMSFLGSPRAGAMLGLMGRTTDEQVETMAEMFRNSSDEEIAAMMRVVEQAMARAAAEPVTATQGKTRRSAAERREARRREGRSRSRAA